MTGQAGWIGEGAEESTIVVVGEGVKSFNAVDRGVNLRNMSTAGAPRIDSAFYLRMDVSDFGTDQNVNQSLSWTGSFDDFANYAAFRIFQIGGTNNVQWEFDIGAASHGGLLIPTMRGNLTVILQSLNNDVILSVGTAPPPAPQIIQWLGNIGPQGDDPFDQLEILVADEGPSQLARINRVFAGNVAPGA